MQNTPLRNEYTVDSLTKCRKTVWEVLSIRILLLKLGLLGVIHRRSGEVKRGKGVKWNIFKSWAYWYGVQSLGEWVLKIGGEAGRRSEGRMDGNIGDYLGAT